MRLTSLHMDFRILVGGLTSPVCLDVIPEHHFFLWCVRPRGLCGVERAIIVTVVSFRKPIPARIRGAKFNVQAHLPRESESSSPRPLFLACASC